MRGIDRYIWLVGQIVADPDVKRLVCVSCDMDTPPAQECGRSELEMSAAVSPARFLIEVSRSGGCFWSCYRVTDL